MMNDSEKEFEVRRGSPRFTMNDIKRPVELSRIVHKIGHEIGNPLTSIISLASIIQRSSADAPETLAQGKLTSYAESIGKEAWRITGLNEKLVLLFSDRPGSSAVCDVEQTIRKTISRLHRRPDYRCYDVAIFRSEAELQSCCDGEQFVWLMSALLENAFQAQAAEKGRSEEAFNDEPLTASIRRAGENIVIEITNIKGSPCTLDLADLFDPFVVEDPEAKRTGLGLTVSAVIAERLKGSIELKEWKTDGRYAFTAAVTLPAAPVAGGAPNPVL